MATHRCEICGTEFGTRSEHDRHMQTSHPPRAPSAADLERALAGVDYPASPDALAARARDRGEDAVAGILERLQDRDYRDAADVSRAFGALRSHKDKPTWQPSVRGGEAAMQTASAARFASLFAGMAFPATREDLRRHASGQAESGEMDLLRRLPERDYHDMSDVAKAFGDVTDDDDGR